MNNVGNKVLSGTSGTAWINNEQIGDLKSIELKVTGVFEDVNVCGDPSTHSKFMGWTGEGSLVFQKTMSRGIKLLATAYKTGIMPDIKIISKLTDVNTGISERSSVEEVVFTEFTLAKYEAKSLIDEELPLKFSKFDVLEVI
jgi:hypothetical protein